MNLRSLFLSIISCISFCGCKKDEPEMIFDITGIPKNLKIRYTEAQIISLSTVYVSGSKDVLTLTAEGLPEGASVTFKPNVKAVPFDFQVYLNTKNVKGGDYTFKIKGKPANSAAATSFDMKMHVADLQDIGCVMEIAGQYGGPPDPSFNMDKPTISPDIIKNRVVFMSCDPSFYANMDCYKQTLEIPRQQVSPGRFVSGTGTYDLKSVNLNVNVEYTNPAGIKNYTFALVRPGIGIGL